MAYAEVEVKLVWNTLDWRKFPNVQFPGRKGHFATTELPTFMVMFNSAGSNALTVSATDMASSPIVYRSTRRGEDRLYQVPLQKVVFGLDKIEPYILQKLGLR